MNITFNELRKIKDTLPDGSIHRIAKELELNVETVWNYFGGYSYANGRPMGVHVEPFPKIRERSTEVGRSLFLPISKKVYVIQRA